MQREVSKSQFKARTLELLRQVEATGEALVITDNGRATLEVRRHRSDQRSPLERLRGSVVDFQDPTEPVGQDDWESVR